MRAETGCLASTHPIAFVSNRSAALTWDLYSMSVDALDTVLVAKGDVRGPAWSPDGQAIAFWLHTRDIGRELAMVDPDGSEFVIVDFDSRDLPPDFTDSALLEGPSWSSDGQRVAFSSRRDGTLRAWVIQRPGGQARVLLPELAMPHAGPRFSRHDPDLVAFVTREGTGDIWIADSREASSARNVTQGRFAYPETPSWSPDGTRLAFSAERVPDDEASREIFVLALDSDEPPLQLTDDLAMDMLPAWSADGLSLLITSDRARLSRAPGERALAPVDLVLVPLGAPETARTLTHERLDPRLGALPQSGGHGMGDWAWSAGCEAVR